MVEIPLYGTAKAVMTRTVSTVTPDTTIRDAAKLMSTARVSGLPVIDTENRVVGIVTEKDLLRSRVEDQKREAWWLNLLAEGEKLAPDFVAYARAGNDIVRRIMHTDILTVTEETPLSEIAVMMVEKGIKRFPVVKDGKLVGIVSRGDLVRALGQRQSKDNIF